MSSPAELRRLHHAAAVRSAILEAAKTLFAGQGYFATTIEQVARRADVSPATVYAVAGGKAGLISRLMQEWADSPVLVRSAQRLTELDDPMDVLRLVASASREVREEHGDVMRVLLATAAHDPTIADGLSASTVRYRRAMQMTAERLRDLGATSEGFTVGEAADVLWFYFGYSGYFTLVDDNGWDVERAEQWLLAQCAHALGVSAGRAASTRAGTGAHPERPDHDEQARGAGRPSTRAAQ